MNKILSIYIALLILSNIAICQPFQIKWQQCLGGSESEFTNDITQTGGGYMIIGNTDSNDGDISNNHGKTDIWLVKLDIYGNLLWERCFGGTEGDGAIRIFGIQNSNDLFIAGGTTSSDGDISYNPYSGSLNYWVLRIDSLGNIIWDRNIGGNGHDNMFNASPTDDGGLLATGYTTSSDGEISDYYGWWDAWTIKLNSDGSKDWDFTIGTSLNHEVGQAVIQTSDGGYIIGGTSRIEGVGNITCIPHTWKAEAILFKLDSNGQEEWQKCYGGSTDEGITAILEVENGYVFLSYTESNDGDVSGFHGTPNSGNDDIWVVRIDQYGDIIWEKCFGGFNDEFAERIFQTEDKGFIVFGITHSNNGDISGNHSVMKENPSIWVFKIDSVGQLMWQQCFGGLSTERVSFGVFKKSDDNYVIAGEMRYGPSFDVGCSSHSNHLDYWVFEIQDTTVGIDEFPHSFDFKVYPNPANTILNVDFIQNNNTENIKIEIIDIYGKTIFRAKPNSDSFEIDISHLSRGLFILRISDDMAIYTKKILKL